MSMQYETAFKIFSDVYGYPTWETKTKEGQNAQEIIKIWEDELRKYTPEQVKQACYRVVKYRKAQTFPTISHLMAELCEEEKVVDEGSQKQRTLKALLEHNPPFNESVIQKVMCDMYQFSYNGYQPEEQEEKQ